MSKFRFFSLGLALLVTLLSACQEDEPVVEPVEVEAKTFSNLAANASTPRTGHYALFRFSDGVVVPTADSATAKWDIGFKATTIIVNGGTSGPGNGGAQVFSGIFNELKEAPVNGYVADAFPNYAITTGSDKGWYNYNSTTNIITPIAGKVIVVRTADGKYAKMEILSYYENAPAAPTATDKSRYFTFRYGYQADGSRRLE